ncbi:MAG: phosphomethylpyrimidine synthase ThiC [Actinomycetota bacterium]|nr:phosphomethylpyrimidine synthase ThiC [Actinomycetota bacterium]
MTIISQVKAGNIPGEVAQVAKDEGVELDLLLKRLAQGRVVIPRNKDRGHIKPIGIGEGLKTKVNANIGTSKGYPSLEEELKKLETVIEAKSDTVMDLSTGGDINQIRREILKRSTIPLGTVPIYQAAVSAMDKFETVVAMDKDHMFEVLREQAKDGVDFFTIHAGLNLSALESLDKDKRLMDVVSRGGVFTIGWMLHNEKENPFYEEFDEVLAIAKEYDVTLSLGDGLRPGCIDDATDRPQIQELLTLGELVDRAREAEVQVMVEGPGHVPLDQIALNIQLQKEVCKGAPFYVLGPLVTDIAPGYDHITSAIGGAYAAFLGADYLCYVTPREHLGLPTVEDVEEGVIASRIAAHAADLAKGQPGAREWDREMAKARKALDWRAEIDISINPKKTAKFYDERNQEQEGTCTMCGDFCAIKLVESYFE